MSIKLLSPDKLNEIILDLNDNKTVVYSVKKNGVLVFSKCELGIATSVGDFTNNLEFVKINNQITINEAYEIPSGKRKICHNYCNEITADFRKDNVDFSIILRAYNDGVAFRYKINSGCDFEIFSEKTKIVFNEDTVIWCNKQYQEWYEFEYKNHIVGKLNDVYKDEEGLKYIQIPFLVKIGEIYVQISESNLSKNYCGISYTSENVDNKTVFTSQFVKSQEGSVNAKSEFLSPWRTFVIGNANTIVESTMIIDLADKSDKKIDYAFVKPGLASWSWLDNEKVKGQWGGIAQHDTQKIKSFIDLASEMGWDYYIMDEGWQPRSHRENEWYNGYYDEFDEWKAYADSKNIKLFAWTNSSDLNTEEKRKRLFDWAKRGIAGIKVDFFNKENQETLSLYNDIYDTCAKAKLMVIAHGANKSTGEEKTYPHVLTKEGIYGQEQGSVTPESAIRSVFTRFSVGNTDFTEYLVARDVNVTSGFQLGMSIVYTSAIHCFADGVTNYRITQSAEMLKNFPPYFDETRFIAGSPDEFVIISRKYNNMWLVGGISNVKTKQIIKLDFLDENTDYNGVLYDDTNDYLKLNRQEITAAKGEYIPVNMSQNGGFLMKLNKK